MKAKINLDYILCILYENDSLKIKDMPIDKNENGIEIFDFINYDHDSFEKLIKDTLSILPFNILHKAGYCNCVNVDYDDTYYQYNAMTFRDLLSEFKSEINQIKRDIRKEFIHNHTLKNEEDKITTYKEAYETLSQDIEETYIKRYDKILNDLKPQILYELTLKNIKIQYPDQLKVFSQDYRGWHNSTFKNICTDLDLMVSTNFSYGKSSYFNITFVYKGVKILTYSDLINYKYANIKELISCTRAYIPKRTNWERVMEFVKEKGELALSKGDSFVTEFVTNEVKKMFLGLDNIIAGKPVYNDTRKETYLQFNIKENYCLQSFLIHPNELAYAELIEKISSVLVFIDNLKQLDKVLFSTKEMIDKLLTYRKFIKEPIEILLKNIEKDLPTLKQRINKQEKVYDTTTNKINEYLKPYDLTIQTIHHHKHSKLYDEMKDDLEDLAYLKSKLKDTRKQYARRLKFQEYLLNIQVDINKY